MSLYDQKFTNQIISEINSIGNRMIKAVDREIVFCEVLAIKDGPWTLKHLKRIRCLQNIRTELAKLPMIEKV